MVGRPRKPSEDGQQVSCLANTLVTHELYGVARIVKSCDNGRHVDHRQFSSLAEGQVPEGVLAEIEAGVGQGRPPLAHEIARFQFW